MKTNLSKEEVRSAEEIWKDVPGYEGLYKVSTHGRVMTLEREVHSGYYGNTIKKIESGLKSLLKNKQTGYLYTRLSKDGVTTRFTIHQLVANTFLTKPDGAQCVNHIDSNRENNHVSNLEWTTFKENVKHSFRSGLRKGSMKGKFGSLHNRSKNYEQQR